MSAKGFFLMGQLKVRSIFFSSSPPNYFNSPKFSLFINSLRHPRISRKTSMRSFCLWNSRNSSFLAPMALLKSRSISILDLISSPLFRFCLICLILFFYDARCFFHHLSLSLLIFSAGPES